jgi:hypothetical protein
MVRALTSSAVDRASETRSDQTKDYKIGSCCFSARHTILWSRANNGLARNHDMCPSWLTCLPADCCFGVLTKRTSSSSHRNKNVDIRFSVYDLLIKYTQNQKIAVFGSKKTKDRKSTKVTYAWGLITLVLVMIYLKKILIRLWTLTHSLTHSQYIICSIHTCICLIIVICLCCWLSCVLFSCSYSEVNA